MNQNPSSGSRPLRWKRWIPSAAAVGAGGTTLAIWFEEVVAFITDVIGVIILTILAGVIYLFDISLFKSTKPRMDDLKK